MSDERLRDLERRWRESGSIDDEAVYLLQRVRVGELSEERLELAAFCGHEAAMAILPSQPTRPSIDDSRTIHEWIRRIPGESVNRIRAASIAARSVLSLWDGRGADPSKGLVAVESWLACPCDDHGERARHVHAEVDRITRRTDDTNVRSVLAGMAPALAARAAAAHGASDCDDWCGRAAQCAANAVMGKYDAIALPLRRTIAAGLVEWALRSK